MISSFDMTKTAVTESVRRLAARGFDFCRWYGELHDLEIFTCPVCG